MSYKFLSTILGIDANFTGSVGVGTTTPATKLDVLGGFRLYTGGAAPSSHYLEGISTSGTNTYLNLVRNGGANGTYAYYLNNGVASLSVDNGTGETRLWANNGGYYLTFFSNGLERMRIASTGNVLIGTTTDAGYKLDVNGTARIQYGTVERGAIFTHSNGTYAEIVLGNGSAAGVGVVEIHRNGTSAISLRSNAVLFNTSRLVTPSTFFVTGPYGGSNIGTSVRLASNTVDQGVYTATSGTQNTVVIGNSGNEIWQPSSGNATYNLFSVLPSINTSGTYAGIVRGFYYSPTLTSITGVTHRAIETVTGDVIFGSTSGNVGIGTTSPTGKLHVIGAVGNGAKITTSGYSNWNSIASFNNDSAGGLFGLDIQAYSDVGGNRIINITTNNTTGINFPNSVSVSSWSLYGCYYNAFWQDAVLYLRNTTGGTGGFKFTSVVTGVLMSILENGSVLIGTTTNAGYKLDVNGTARINNTLTVSNSSYTGSGSFYQAANSTTVIAGGPASENITFGPSNRIFINAQQIRIPSGSLQISSTLTVGSITATSTNMIWANGSITAGSNIARGIYTDTTLVASANNDVLVGLDISPTFTNGAFTGLTNLGLRVNSGVSLFSGNVVLNGTNLYFGSNLGNVVIRPVQTTNFQIFNNNSGATLFLNANGAIQIGQSNVTNWARFSATGHTIYGTTNTNFYSNGNVGIATASDNGYKLQVNGNVNINTANTTNNLVVNADTSMFYNLTSGGGQVKSNVYTTSVATRYYVPASSTEYLIEWDPTLCQGIFVDYVLMIVGLNYIRSGTLVIANDNGGNVTITDNINSSVNGSSTAFVTFSAAGAASIKLGCDNLLSTNDAYVNIITRYIPNIY